MIIVE